MILPPDDGTTADAPPVHPPKLHPTYRRMVNTNSREAALLRHAGLQETDIPPSPEGGIWVTMAEVEAEIARRGLSVALPEPLPPLEAKRARDYVRAMLRHGAHLMRLREGSKTPVEMAWQDSPALTEDEATDWLVRGNGLGINLRQSGPNGWMVIDAENAAATRLLKAAGLYPTARTANSQDKTSEKYGGSHVYLEIPADVDLSELKSTLQFKLDGGGVVDILVGTRYAVAPGTRLDSTPGFRYGCAAEGALIHPERWMQAPRWLFDRDAPAPDVPGIEALHGIARANRRERRARQHSPASDQLTQKIDEVSWEEWLNGDPRVQILGVDGSCGCDVFHWAGASTQRSGILHEGCNYGYGVHIFSGTLNSQCGREHMSKLDFAAWLRGRSDDLVSLAAEFGITMGASPSGFTAAQVAEITGRAVSPELQVIPGDGETVTSTDNADSPRTPLAAVPPIGSVAGDTPVEGATALEAAPSPAPADVEPEPVPEPELDTGIAMFAALEEIDRSGFWESTPFLRKIARAADSNGIGRWGALGGALPRVAVNVPPEVRLVGGSGKPGGTTGGTSINLNTILTGPPEAGKSETIKVTQDLISIPAHAMPITNGTGEGILKSYMNTKKADKKKDGEEGVEPEIPTGAADPNAPAAPRVGNVGRPGTTGGYETVHITDTVMLTAGEIGGMIAEMRRQGTKATAVYRSAWMGEELGSTTGEVERRTYLAAHTYRFGAVLGAQVDADTLGAIFDEGKLGSPQRFLFLPALTVQAVGDPLSSIELPYIDWYDGQAPAAAVAGMVGARPPIWIRRPPAAHKEMEANRLARQARRHLAYSVADVRRRAEEDDEIADMVGHELLHQFKIAAVLSIADGLRHPTDAHWHAAGVIMRVRELVMKTLLKVIEAQREIADRKRGRSQGRSQAEARLAEQEAKQDHKVEVAKRIMSIIAEKGVPTSESDIGKGLGNSKSRYRLVASDALAELVSSELLFVVDYNSKGNGLFWTSRDAPPGWSAAASSRGRTR